MKRALGFLLLILFLTGSRTLAQIKDYYYKNFQNLGNFQQQSSRSSALILSTPIQGTVNMAIILCVEKGQPRNFPFRLLLIILKIIALSAISLTHTKAAQISLYLKWSVEPLSELKAGFYQSRRYHQHFNLTIIYA